MHDSSAIDWEKIHIVTQEWLKKDFSLKFSEWQYRWIEPKLFIEEYMLDKNNRSPLDYKFFCFNGRVELIQVDYDRFNEHTRTIFDRNFKPIDIGLEFPRYKGSFHQPKCFFELINIAEVLSKDEPFLRVDLYDFGKPIFGELTLHPGAGFEKFHPSSWDFELGKLF